MALPKNFKTQEGTGGRYMKFKDGENKFRILGNGIAGFQMWNNKQPVRREQMDQLANEEGDGNIKQFLALPVWNYNEEKIQVLLITQKTVMKAIEDLEMSEDWGDALGYDLVVKRSGRDLDTEYSVRPCPKRDVPEALIQEYLDWKIKLENLYTNDDPFTGGTEANETPF